MPSWSEANPNRDTDAVLSSVSSHCYTLYTVGDAENIINFICSLVSYIKCNVVLFTFEDKNKSKIKNKQNNTIYTVDKQAN